MVILFFFFATVKKQAEALTDEDEELLWSKGFLGDHSPKSLLNTIFYMCGLYFALRSGGEHRSLRLAPPQITVHEEGATTYLLYTEDCSKNVQGGLKHRKIAQKKVKHFANTDNPQRCFVRLYRLYLSKLPVDCPRNAFYFKPLQNWNSTSGSVWFSKQPLGHNKLSMMMSSICQDAGIQGFKTNHSLRATSATRLYQQGADEQLIMERTGHRSLEGVRSYKRTSVTQQKAISSMLQQTTNAAMISTTDINTLHSMTPTATSEAQKFHLQQCSGITINNYYY